MDGFGMNFPPPFFKHKKDDIQCVFFHKIKDGNFIMLWNEFQGVFFICFIRCKFLTKNRWILLYVFYLFMGVWISDTEWMNFMVCFSSIYGAWISDKEQMNFMACFSSVYGNVNFWQRMDEFYGMLLISLWGVNFWQRIDKFPLKDGFILFGISVLLNYFYQL